MNQECSGTVRVWSMRLVIRTSLAALLVGAMLTACTDEPGPEPVATAAPHPASDPTPAPTAAPDTAAVPATPVPTAAPHPAPTATFAARPATPTPAPPSTSEVVVCSYTAALGLTPCNIAIYFHHSITEPANGAFGPEWKLCCWPSSWNRLRSCSASQVKWRQSKTGGKVCRALVHISA